MNQTDIHNKKTDLAWEQLHTRLEQDGLLSDISTQPPSFNRIRAVSWAAAIAVLCISLAAIYYMTLPQKDNASFLTMQNNDNATTLVTTLEDGSVVFLAENAVLRYPEHFDADKRQVILEGNAQFDVSGNKNRPFYIETKEIQVEVIGTSFQIRNRQGSPFELAVTKGEVKVTAKGSNDNCLVKAGEKVQLLDDGLLVSFMDGYDLNDVYASRIRFKDEKLGDILNVLNKGITDTPLEITSTLEDRAFTVDFENNTPEEMAEVICELLNLQYICYSDKIVISSD